MTLASEFHDSYGLTHDMPNHISENAPLFTAEELLLSKLNGEDVTNRARKAILDLFDFTEMRWKDRAGAAGYHHSLDNMTGVYLLGVLAGTQPWNILSGLDKQVSTPHWHLHPRDRITWGIVEKKPLYYLGYPLLVVMCAETLFAPKNATSGKIKWFLHWYLVHGTVPRFYLKMLELQYGDKPLEKLFKIYFPYDNHPINIIVRSLYIKGIL